MSLSELVGLSTGIQWVGNKERLLPEILCRLAFCKSVYEPFTGSANVGSALRQAGKFVTANDLLSCSCVVAKATIGNPGETLAAEDLDLLSDAKAQGDFLTRVYGDKIFLRRDTRFLDRLAWGIVELSNTVKQAIAMAAAVRAMIKHSSWGRFNVGLNNHLVPSKLAKHEKRSLEALFLESVDHFNKFAKVTGPVGRVYNRDVFAMPRIEADGCYIDWPYPTVRRQSSYEYFYHFPEIFVCYGDDWPLAERGLAQKRKTSEFSRPNKFLMPVYERFLTGVAHIPTLVISHASHCRPTFEQIVARLKKQGRKVTWDRFPARYARSAWSKNAQPDEILITARMG